MPECLTGMPECLMCLLVKSKPDQNLLRRFLAKPGQRLKTARHAIFARILDRDVDRDRLRVAMLAGFTFMKQCAFARVGFFSVRLFLVSCV